MSHKLLAAIVVVAVLAGIGGGSVLAYYNLKGRADRLQAALTIDIQAGQRELEAGKASLTDANSKRDPTLITAAITHFANAKTQFLAASQAADSSRLLSTLELVPAVGGLVRSRQDAVDGLAMMGAALSDAGQDVANLDALLIKPASTGQAGKTLLTVLNQANAGLPTIHADLERAQKAAAEVDVQVVPVGQRATFGKARNLIDSALGGLDEFARLVPVLTEVLGGNGVRNYLVEQVNPSELRAGGGFIGSYSLLNVDQGKMTIQASGDSYVLADPRPLPGQAGFIPLPDAYREVIPQVSWSFVDSDLFPDFPSNAKQAETFAQPHLGLKLDGVIAIDYYAVARMLQVTGPLAVPGYSVTVDAATFVSFIAQHDFAQDAIHKAILSAIAGPLMSRITNLQPDRWPELLSALNDVATGRHLQAYFNSPSAEQAMNRLGWSGVVNPTGARDFMMEVDSNYGGSKSNYFVTRHYTVTLTHTGNSLHHVVTIDLANNTPYLATQIVHYKDYMRLYVGADVAGASDNLRAPAYKETTPPVGTDLMDGWLPDIECCGATGKAVLDYTTPWPTGQSDQIYWQKQPGVVNDLVDVTWNDGSGHTYKARGDLNADRVITLTPTGVTLTAGQAAQAKLPSLSLG